MISTSIFELFKIGPGPSSSHTVGPMYAAFDFRKNIIDYISKLSQIHELSVIVELYGSLSDTGIGHGTHKAIVAGLMGDEPTTVNIERLTQIFENRDEVYSIDYNGTISQFKFSDIVFVKTENPYRHPNTVKFQLINNYKIELVSIYYSIGGGFIEKDGEELSRFDKNPKYAYSNMKEFNSVLAKTGLSVTEILIENEMAISGMTRDSISTKLEKIINTMIHCVDRGLLAEGILPGGLNVRRRAKSMYEDAVEMAKAGDRLNSEFYRMNAYALAVSEENAAGHLVVTAPTNGAAGIIPATIYYLLKDSQKPLEMVKEALLVSALIGFIIKENASISGAELGCMAEVGAATSMASALFTYCFGGSFKKQEIAAEIALEHSLGMTCDPINGLVQVPCIERNATGVIKAYNSYVLSTGRKSDPLVSLDQVIKAMKETGTDLSLKYKETSSGGLAIHGWGNMPGS